MKKSRFSEEQIAYALRMADGGTPAAGFQSLFRVPMPLPPDSCGLYRVAGKTYGCALTAALRFRRCRPLHS